MHRFVHPIGLYFGILTCLSGEYISGTPQSFGIDSDAVALASSYFTSTVDHGCRVIILVYFIKVNTAVIVITTT